jgi:hypothetical protein
MKTEGFYIKTDKGNTAHVLGNKNMPKDQMVAIKKMIDLAYSKSINTLRKNISDQ